MAFPPNSLRAFLRYAKDRLSEALEGKRKVNLVIGNESAGEYIFGNHCYTFH